MGKKSKKELAALSAKVSVGVKAAGTAPEGWLLDKIEAIYRKTGNPMFAWRAYGLCRKWGEPLPDWVLEYLDGAATKLLRRANSETPPGNGASDEIASALDMLPIGGGGNVFTRYKNDGLRFYAAEIFWKLKWENPKEDDDLISQWVWERLILERGKKIEGKYSPVTIKKWAKELKSQLYPDIPLI